MTTDDPPSPAGTQTAAYRPNPATAGTPQEYITQLRALKAWQGDPSLRELQRRTGLARSTIADALDPRRKNLPPLGMTTAILRALEADNGELDEWTEVWRTIQIAGTQRFPSPQSAELPVEPPAEPAAGPADAPGSAKAQLKPRQLIGLIALVALAITAAIVLRSPSGQNPGPYAGRIAFDAQGISSTEVLLPVLAAVGGHHALIVTIALTSTGSGDVNVSDTAQDAYAVVSDVTDNLKHRTMIVAAFDVKPLSTKDSITVTYPAASKYQIAVDEYSHISSAGHQATAFGPQGGTSFTTNTTPISCGTGDLVIAAVTTNSGSAPALPASWTTLGVLKLSSYRLTTAYQTVTAAGLCTITGTTTSQWEAAIATFH